MDEITLENEAYVSTNKAAEITGYANDYVGQLCRAGKLEATRIGRGWYVKKSSLLKHHASKKKSPEEVELSVEQTEESVHAIPIRKANHLSEGKVAPEKELLQQKEGNQNEIDREPAINTTPTPFHYADKNIASYETDDESPLLPPLRNDQVQTVDLKPRIQGSRVPVIPEEPSVLSLKVREKQVPRAYQDVHPARLSLFTRYQKVAALAALVFLVFAVGLTLTGAFLSSSFKEGVTSVGGAVLSTENGDVSGHDVVDPLRHSAQAFTSLIDTSVYNFLYGDLF